MADGDVLRAARLAAGLSLSAMASRTYYSKSLLSQVENGHRAATEDLVTAYERVLGVALADVRRRDFFKVAGFVAGNVAVVSELGASLAAGDAGPLTTVQTTYGVDLALASLVDRRGVQHLRAWLDDPSPVLRVNAAGILGKLPGQAEAATVAAVLNHDEQVRERYATAVVARLFGVEWSQAAGLAADPVHFPRPALAAQRLTQEVVSPRDVGARWCSAMLLQRLSPAIGG